MRKGYVVYNRARLSHERSEGCSVTRIAKARRSQERGLLFPECPTGQDFGLFHFAKIRPVSADGHSHHAAQSYACFAPLFFMPLPMLVQAQTRQGIKKQSYGLRKIVWRGGNNRARTCDIYLVRVALYQLSYASTG